MGQHDIEKIALDDAYAEEVRKLFGVLVDNLVEAVPGEAADAEAVGRFRNGLAAVRAAYELAVTELE